MLRMYKILLFFIKDKSILHIKSYSTIVRINLIIINKHSNRVLTYFSLEIKKFIKAFNLSIWTIRKSIFITISNKLVIKMV